MMRMVAILGALLLAACQPVPLPTASTPNPGAPKGPEIVVLVAKTGQPARDLMHHIAARCWLDGIVRGAQLIVKPGGNLIIVGDTTDLLAADYLGLKGNRSRWRLSGDVIRNRAKTQALVRTLDRAVRTGQTACPIGTA